MCCGKRVSNRMLYVWKMWREVKGMLEATKNDALQVVRNGMDTVLYTVGIIMTRDFDRIMHILLKMKYHDYQKASLKPF